ncbi:CocE/NonD family hydrolase [Salaquimonas pukyongi]|uniref:CocE/NonD family hydrolase n=1 Tax=Salaquimonas pukyongi TaxID=2712698 RepID=UPI00096B90CB|nr:CocE/NonD family hydrolase [Salaquimonas pukyongi]
MKIVSQFPRKAVENPDVTLTMSDGCRLSARLWLPEDAEENPVPVILEHLPYRKRDGTIARDEQTHPWLAGHGYACLRVDMRGNGDSDGLMADEYTPQELQDACEAIAWAAGQPWCNGKAGMMGISWGGFNSLQVAALRPPALKAIITICSTVDRYADDIHYKGGCLLGENFGWAATMLAYSSRPPDPALAGNRWHEMWMHRLNNQPFHIQQWLRHQWRDAYWKHGSVCEDYAAIDAAVLAIGGWHDGYRNTMAHLAENLPEHGNDKVKAIAGPWIHKYPHIAKPEPAIDFLGEAKRWWDKWLKDAETGVEDDPAFRLWLMDSIKPNRWMPERPGRWIACRNWPDPAIESKTLTLGLNTLDDAGGDGEGNAGAFSLSVCSPQDCGICGGEFFPFAYSDELPGEQTPDDEKSLCFDGEPLKTPIDIVGAPAVKLTLSSDRPHAQIAVRLCDLRPDGTSALITLGVLNLTHHRSHEHPEPLTPGESFEAVVTLDQIAYRVPAGHRLRLAVSTAYWPLIWPSPEAATLTLSGGALKLPLRPLAEADEWQFDPPQGSPAWKIEVLRTPSYSHEAKKDADGGKTLVLVDNDMGEQRDLNHGLISGSHSWERWSIDPDDPTSAVAEIDTEKTGGRDGQRWKTRIETRMSCDKENFLVEANLKSWENDKVVFERDYSDTIERKLV